MSITTLAIESDDVRIAPQHSSPPGVAAYKGVEYTKSNLLFFDIHVSELDLSHHCSGLSGIKIRMGVTVTQARWLALAIGTLYTWTGKAQDRDRH